MAARRFLLTTTLLLLAGCHSPALAKFIIFERDGASHWPACSRKIGLARQVADIKARS